MIQTNVSFPDEEIDNKRFKTFKFKVEQDSVLHGFSGYFDTVLYKDVKLSIVPESHSKGMFSWFPIYFPIKVGNIYMIFRVIFMSLII